ncbi:MAG: LysR family transcriptional regulator [Parachlamydiales bacterium]|nr:LysR family transcriptional regulator [Parachlamydiales bacterium]
MNKLKISDQIQKSELEKIESKLSCLRIADLELFITAAYMKNLGKAAIFHNLSQSAASTAIQRVEYALGLLLCSHEKRKFSLTRRAEILLPRFENWVKQLRELIMFKQQVPIRIFTTHAIAQIATPALLEIGNIEFGHMRPDQAYEAIIHGKADLAIVLDNAPWKGVVTTEIGKGNFQLYSKNKNVCKKPVIIPENQMEGLFLQQSWLQKYNHTLPVKARISSWSLIADICANSDEVGFLPDFLAMKFNLHAVLWQPDTYKYRILGIHKEIEKLQKERFDVIIKKLKNVFTNA